MPTGDVVYSLRFSLIKILPAPGFDLGSTAGESCVLTARLHMLYSNITVSSVGSVCWIKDFKEVYRRGKFSIPIRLESVPPQQTRCTRGIRVVFFRARM